MPTLNKGTWGTHRLSHGTAWEPVHLTRIRCLPKAAHVAPPRTSMTSGVTVSAGTTDSHASSISVTAVRTCTQEQQHDDGRKVCMLVGGANPCVFPRMCCGGAGPRPLLRLRHAVNGAEQRQHHKHCTSPSPSGRGCCGWQAPAASARCDRWRGPWPWRACPASSRPGW